MSSIEDSENQVQAYIIHKNGQVYVELPALRLVGKGATVQEAYDDAFKQREGLLATYREADILDHLPDLSNPSADGATSPTPSRSLKSFALKSSIIAGVIAVALLILTSAVTNQISKKAAEINLGGKQIQKKLEQGLARAANSSKRLPKERRDKITSDLEKLALRVKPYIDAISRGLSNEGSKGSSPEPKPVDPRP